MKELYIRQKVLSLSGKFTVKDQQDQDVYVVEGSFMKIPKTFSMMNIEGREVALITKKIFSWMPQFTVEVDGRDIVTIRKRVSFFKSRYTIDAANIEVHGNWWDMDFEVLQHGEVIGKVNKKWFTWGDSYHVQVWNEDMETMIVALVIAIDCVKADQGAAAASS